MSYSHPDALPHGEITEMFDEVFFVTGQMATNLLDMPWKFSRNMTIIRNGDALTLVNAIRLNEAGLDALQKLGRIENIVRIGSFHDRDSRFYVETYGANYFDLPGMPPIEGLENGQSLIGDTPLALPGLTLFTFKTSALPEAILHLDRDGGILVACDSLQNWLAPDAYFDAETADRMTGMGFFKPANIGPFWAKMNAPQAEDFRAIQSMSFKHLLSGHGVPLCDDAHRQFSATFAELYGIE